MDITHAAGLFTALLIPVLFIIHSLRNRSVKKKTATLFIWEAVLNEQKGQITLTSLLRNLSLLLQVLVILLVSLALARPVFFSGPDSNRTAILVMDTSASMKTLAGKGTRFDLARARSLEIVENLSCSTMIIDAGRTPEILARFTRDKALLARTLRQMAPKDTPGNMEKALYLALSFLSGEAASTIHVITDGAGYDLLPLVNLNPAICPVLVRGGTDNIAITRFEVRPVTGRKDQYEILAEIKNYTPSPVIVPVRVKTGNIVISDQSTGLDARQKKTLVFFFSGKVQESVTAEIRVTDDFSLDNKVYGVLNPREKTDVFLVSKGNFFLEAFLTVCPDLRVTVSPGISEASWQEITARNHIVILDNTDLPGGSTGNFLLMNSLSADLPVKSTGRVHRPEISDWNTNSPLMAGVTPDRLAIDTAMKLEIQNDSRMIPILASRETPLITAFRDTSLKAVLMGFELRNSDLPLRVAFPVLMSNIFQWLHPVGRQVFSATLRAGEPFEIHLEQGADPLLLRRPSNTWTRHKTGKGLFVYDKTDAIGLYKIRENRESHVFAVNLTDETESDILGPETDIPVLSRKAGQDQASAGSRAKSLWPLFLSAALAICLLETLVWMKKE